MRESPQTDRVVAVLNLLSIEPQRGYSLSELATRLSVHKVTLYPMLSALIRAGFVTRTGSSKLFRLGPSVIAIGEAAAQSLSVLAATRIAVHELHSRLRLPCYAGAVSEKVLTLVEIADADTAVEGSARRGQRHTLEYPSGVGVIAWQRRDVIEDWMTQAWPACDREELQRSLTVIRERGYSVERRAGSVPDVVSFLKSLKAHPLPADERQMLDQFEQIVSMRTDFIIDAPLEDESYGVVTLDAPVFNSSAIAEMQITVVMPEPPNAGKTIAEVGALLVEHARLATAMVGGRPPPD